MPLLVKDSPQGKKCLPPAEKTAYREEKKLLTAQRKKSLPCGEKTAYRVVVNSPYHPQSDGTASAFEDLKAAALKNVEIYFGTVLTCEEMERKIKANK